jgi:hypothetical protein
MAIRHDTRIDPNARTENMNVISVADSQVSVETQFARIGAPDLAPLRVQELAVARTFPQSRMKHVSLELGAPPYDRSHFAGNFALV